MSELALRICKAISEVFGTNGAPLHAPVFEGNEKKYLNDCIDSTFVSTVGEYVTRFENELAEYTGAKHVIEVTNGTIGLQLGLKVAGVVAGDEVIIPPLTFVATANAVGHAGGVAHFSDIEPMTLGLCPERLRGWLNSISCYKGGACHNRHTDRRIAAIVPVHVFGHPCDLDGLTAVANDFDLTLVEDAAEGLGSFYHGKHVGLSGRVGILSFNGNKIITTGGGGALLTDDEELAFAARHLSTTAKIEHPWEYRHDQMGFNFRMPNINAALGVAQLESISDRLKVKRDLYYEYKSALDDIPEVELLSEPAGCQSNYWLQTLKFDDQSLCDLSNALLVTNERSWNTRPAWTLLHQLPCYKDNPRSCLRVAEKLAPALMNLPSNKR